MKRLANLIDDIAAAVGDASRIAVVVDYLIAASAADATWAIRWLSGIRPQRLVAPARLRAEVCAAAAIADWLFDDCLKAVGDRTETWALLWPAPDSPDPALPLSALTTLLAATSARSPRPGDAEVESRIAALLALCSQVDNATRRVALGIASGTLRSPLPAPLLVRALAAWLGSSVALIALRLPGWLGLASDARAIAGLGQAADAAEAAAMPSDWARQVAIDDGLSAAPPDETLTPMPMLVLAWHDGPRAQIVCHGGRARLWREQGARVESVSTSGLPDGSAVEGVWLEGDGAPALIVDTVWRWPGVDLAALSAQSRLGLVGAERSSGLAIRIAQILWSASEAEADDDGDEPSMRCPVRSPITAAARVNPTSATLTALAPLHHRCREHGVAGLLLRGSGSGASHHPDRIWRARPLSIAAVLIQAQATTSTTFSEFGFAVWNRRPRDDAEIAAVVEAIAQRRHPHADDLQLVVFAKTSAGIDDLNQRDALDALVKATTVERFGPVRSVLPSLVAAITFDAVVRSPRRKSGVATTAPRIDALQPGLTLNAAATVADLLALVAGVAT
jgi:DNA ligase-1